LSRDHRPVDPEEMKRIKENGGEVIGGRLQGELAVSRAFGDYRFKNTNQSLLICEPEIRQFQLTADIEFIVVACDGLYETFTNEEVIEYITQKLVSTLDLSEIAKTLAEEAIDRGSGDNITIIIIKFEKKFRKILSAGVYGISTKKKQTYEDIIPMKRKSLDTYKVSLTESKKRPLPRPVESTYDEILESDSIDELNDSPNVSFLAEYPEPDIKLRIKKKDPASKTIKSNKKSRSKELYNTIMVKKAKSKEDIPSNDSKKTIKPPLLRRRSKSNDAGRIPKDAEKRSKKKGDSSSDELEKDLIKAISKKKKRNSMNSKYPNDPSSLTLRSTMNESLLSKNSKSKKTKSEANSANSSFKSSGSDKDGNNAKSRSTSTENNSIKSTKPLPTAYPGTSLLSSDFTSTDRVDKLQSPKTSPYVFKKQH